MLPGVPLWSPQRPTHRRRLLHPLQKKERGSIRRGGRRWLLLRRQIHPSPHRRCPPTLKDNTGKLDVDLAVVMAAAVEAGAATTADFGQTKLLMMKTCRGAIGRQPPSSPMRPFRPPRRALRTFFGGSVFQGVLRRQRRWRQLPPRRRRHPALAITDAVVSVKSISSSSGISSRLPRILTRSALRSHKDSVARRLRVARRVSRRSSRCPSVRSFQVT